MRGADRAVLAGLALAGLIAAFWFFVLAPKREEAGNLKDEVAALQQSVTQQEQLAAAAEEAQEDYSSNYRRLVVFGKAVPEDADTSSLLLTLGRIAGNAEVDFRNLQLSSSGGAAQAPTSTPPAVESGSEAAQGAQTSATATAPAAPTEASAALLPIGATVGPAGLPVMPYKLSFRGDFFNFADLIGGLDRMVSTRKKDLRVDGRLVTIDGFSFSGDPDKGFPHLVGSFAVTTYLTPESQGLTAGGTAAGPVQSAPAAVPASTDGGTP